MKVTPEGSKVSRYLTAGSPQQCFLPSCHKAFEQSCVRGEDGHFYCSHICSEIGGKLDLSRVEELRSAPPSPLPTPKQKLSIRG